MDVELIRTVHAMQMQDGLKQKELPKEARQTQAVQDTEEVQLQQVALQETQLPDVDLSAVQDAGALLPTEQVDAKNTAEDTAEGALDLRAYMTGLME